MSPVAGEKRPYMPSPPPLPPIPPSASRSQSGSHENADPLLRNVVDVDSTTALCSLPHGLTDAAIIQFKCAAVTVLLARTGQLNDAQRTMLRSAWEQYRQRSLADHAAAQAHDRALRSMLEASAGVWVAVEPALLNAAVLAVNISLTSKTDDIDYRVGTLDVLLNALGVNRERRAGEGSPCKRVREQRSVSGRTNMEQGLGQ